VERLTGNELDAIHKFKIGKAAKGNVAEKRAAVAAVLGLQQAVQCSAAGRAAAGASAVNNLHAQ
jgi:hypothetical protein